MTNRKSMSKISGCSSGVMINFDCCEWPISRSYNKHCQYLYKNQWPTKLYRHTHSI